MNILQDILGLITKGKVKTPTDKDYMVVAAYTDAQEILKPQPKMQANLINLRALKNYIVSGIAPPKYKVFTALLTQSGGDDLVDINSGLLTIGVTYVITNEAGIGGWDFTNVGAPNNEIGTYFMATGTIPANWNNGYLQYTAGAPVATVLENTIGNIWWIYNGTGLYSVNSNMLFIENKIYLNNKSVILDDTNILLGSSYNGASNIFYITWDGGSVGDGYLFNTPIEIRVYN